MTNIPLRLPDAYHERLRVQAARLRCSCSAITRALVVQGLEALEAAAEEVA